MPKLWTKKPLAELQAEAADIRELTAHGAPLKRTLTAASLMALGIGDIIGAGIFVLTGHAAAANAGPAIALSFLLGGVACALAGLCYSELASSVPISGSAYTYAYATMGELIAWIIGWDLLLEYALGAATVAIGWSGYVVSFLGDFGIAVPQAYSTAPVDFDSLSRTWHATGALINVPAMLVALLRLLARQIDGEIGDCQVASGVAGDHLDRDRLTKRRGQVGVVPMSRMQAVVIAVGSDVGSSFFRQQAGELAGIAVEVQPVRQRLPVRQGSGDRHHVAAEHGAELAQGQVEGNRPIIGEGNIDVDMDHMNVRVEHREVIDGIAGPKVGVGDHPGEIPERAMALTVWNRATA